VPANVVSADPQELVTEISHETQAPAECLDIPVEHITRGDIASFDLTDAALSDTHPAGDLRLSKTATAADFCQAPTASLSEHLLLARFEVSLPDSIDVLIADIRPFGQWHQSCPSSSARSFR